uniref:P-loop containing nucleoside triphosphate hydrolase protein n=1 Tax=Macrostomum lignano TaxID=282301 RepID=A0A1I8HYQ7_9PLAT
MSNSRQTVKLAIIGDKGVGKSSLMERHHKQDNFECDRQRLNVGLAYSVCLHRCGPGSEDVELRVWELPAGESYSAIAECYAADADALLLLFDATRQDSTLEFLQRRIAQQQLLAASGQPAMLVCCKSDAEQQQCEELPDKLNFLVEGTTVTLPLRAASALTGIGVDTVFNDIVNAVLQKRLQQQQQQQSAVQVQAVNQGDQTTGVPLRRRASKLRSSLRRSFSIRSRGTIGI